MKEVNSGIELEKFLDALTQRKAKPDDWVQMSLRALHEIIETHRQQERERIIEEIRVTPNDVLEVGNHYWDNDYYPTQEEISNMAFVWEKKLKDIIKNLK